MASADDHGLARLLAEETGELLLDLRRRHEGSWTEWLRSEGDRAAHEHLAHRLRDTRPDDGVLSEEGYDDGARLRVDRVWVVDPLDGTREFGEPGRPDWAVHVALSEHGEVTAGAVALPAMGVLLATDQPPAVPPMGDRRVRVVTSRFRAPHTSMAVARALDAEVVSLGSAGAKAMMVVLGEVDVYAHTGGMYEWDSAAPVAVAQAAGLHVSRADGRPLRYNRQDPWLPDLLICRPELAETCLDAISSVW